MSDWSESGSDHRPRHLAAPEGEVRANTPAVDETLRRVVVTYRLLVTIWMWILVGAVVGTGGPGSRPILLGALMFSTAWAGLTFWAGKATDRLGSASFLVLDGIVALALSGVGLIAGTDDFVSGGWPASWLFTVAFALTLKMTVVASFVLLAEHVLLHLAHGLNVIRIAGTFQFVVFAVIIGWAFDSLRDRERLRLRLQEELDREREELEIQREAAARHEERSSLARHLHDEVLQTFHAIEVSADRPEQVLYFVRRQTRELRRTIEEFRSPYSCSFRASLMRCRDEVEELYRGVKIREVIRTDAEVDPALEAVLGAAREAMMNAAKHAGVDQVDLYSEIEGDFVVVNVRDRGSGFDTDGPGGRRIATLMNERVEQAEGTVTIRSQPGRGTEVSIMAPLA